MKKQKEITKRRLKWNFTRLVNIFNEKVKQELIDEQIGMYFKGVLEYIHVELLALVEDYKEDRANNLLELLYKLKKMLLGTWREKDA